MVVSWCLILPILQDEAKKNTGKLKEETWKALVRHNERSDGRNCKRSKYYLYQTRFNRKIIGKIGIITLFSGFNYEVVGPASTKNKREYAEKHGYSFYDESASPALALVEDRHPQWQKIPVVLSRLKEQDWLLW